MALLKRLATRFTSAKSGPYWFMSGRRECKGGVQMSVVTCSAAASVVVARLRKQVGLSFGRAPGSAHEPVYDPCRPEKLDASTAEHGLAMSLKVSKLTCFKALTIFICLLFLNRRICRTPT